MANHIVCISFDFDAMSGWIARGMTTPTPISRGEFGVIGAARILALLKKHGIPSTWFIPGHTLETYPEACRRVVEGGHEIGHHGWTHRPPASLSRDEEEDGGEGGRSRRGYASMDPEGRREIAGRGRSFLTGASGHSGLVSRLRRIPGPWPGLRRGARCRG